MLTTASSAVSTDERWPLTTVVPRSHPPVCLPGEPTAAAGLVIVPQSDTSTRRYTGMWSVLHTATGVHVGPAMLPLVYARELARVLADTGVDWTAPGHVLTDPTRRLADVVARLRDQVYWAWDEGRPAWWARSSWTHVRPAWRITYVRGEHASYLDTWTDLMDWLTLYPGTAGYDPLYDGVAEITRDPDATWQLTCAAPLCDHHSDGDGAPAVASHTDIEDGDDWYEIRYPDRGTVARAARAEGWTRHDRQHWTCPACTAAHTRAADPFYGW